MRPFAFFALAFLAAACGGPSTFDSELQAAQQDAKSTSTGGKHGGTTTSADGGATSTTDGGSASAVAVALGFAQDSQTNAFATSFPIATTVEVWIAADWSGLAAGSSHTQRLDLYAPNGTLYQSTTVSFTASSSGTARAWDYLYVAGTPVQSYDMVGTWTAQVSLDGGPVAGTGAFALY